MRAVEHLHAFCMEYSAENPVNERRAKLTSVAQAPLRAPDAGLPNRPGLARGLALVLVQPLPLWVSVKGITQSS
jgi:hypothetical protein